MLQAYVGCVYEQNNIVKHVRVDEGTAELAIIASDDSIIFMICTSVVSSLYLILISLKDEFKIRLLIMLLSCANICLRL